MKDLKFKKAEYLNGNLAIEMVGEYQDEFYDDVISVNLVDAFTPKDYVYLDTNNYPFIGELLVELGVAEKTDFTCHNGWVNYPLYKINVDMLEEDE